MLDMVTGFLFDLAARRSVELVYITLNKWVEFHQTSGVVYRLAYRVFISEIPRRAGFDSPHRSFFFAFSTILRTPFCLSTRVTVNRSYSVRLLVFHVFYFSRAEALELNPAANCVISACRIGTLN